MVVAMSEVEGKILREESGDGTRKRPFYHYLEASSIFPLYPSDSHFRSSSIHQTYISSHTYFITYRQNLS